MSGFFAREEELRRQDQLMRRTARRVARSEADVDDAVQEAWLCSLVRPPASEHSLSSWLRVVVNRSALRQAWRERARRSMLRAVARPAATPSVLSVLDDCGARERAEDLIARLEEPYRTVLQLRFLEDFSITEIALRLGRPEVTVRSQLKRGLDQLRPRVDDRRRLAGLMGLAWRWLSRDRSARPMLAALVAIGVVAVGVLLFEEREPSSGLGLVASPPEESLAALPHLADERQSIVSSVEPATAAAIVEATVSASAAFAQGLVHRQGSGVAGAEIWGAPLLAPPTFLLDATRLLGRTDDAGRFHVELPAENTIVWAEDVQKNDDGTERARTGSGRYALLDVDLGTEASIDLEIVELARIRGVVQDSRGEPASGLRVSCVQTMDDASLGAEGVFQMGPHPAWTTTDASGRFELPMLSSGLQAAWVERDGLAIWAGELTDADDVTIRLPDPATVRGTVVSPAGEPIADCEVRLNTPGRVPERTLRTGPQGELRFESVPPGACTLSVLPERTGLSAVKRLRCVAGETCDLGNVVVSSAWSLTGMARLDGAPLSGWRVITEQLRTDGMLDLIETFTGADGSFEFKACRRRQYDVYLMDPADTVGSPWAKSAAVRPGDVALLEAQRPSALLYGVTEGFEIRPRLAIQGSELPGAIQLPLSARGSFEQRLPPGRYALSVFLPGLGELVLPELDLAAGEQRCVELTPPATGSLEVHLALPATPSSALVVTLAGCGLESQFVAGSPAKTGVLDTSTGTLSVSSLLPGSYQLTARAPSLGVVRREVVVKAGETTWLDVALEPGDLVTVRFDAERPLRVGEGLEVALSSSGLEIAESVTANAVGTGRFENVYRLQQSLSHGDYSLEVQSTGGLSGSLRFSVPGETSLALLLSERPKATR